METRSFGGAGGEGFSSLSLISRLGRLQAGDLMGSIKSSPGRGFVTLKGGEDSALPRLSRDGFGRPSSRDGDYFWCTFFRACLVPREPHPARRFCRRSLAAIVGQGWGR